MRKILLSIFIILAVAGSAFSQTTYTSTKGYSFTVPAIWKDMPVSVYFGGRDAGSITYETLGIDKALMLTTSDTLQRPHIIVFALGDTKAQDFETAISDANNILGLGVVTFTSADDIKSMMVANPKKVFIDKERKILIGEGDPDPTNPQHRSIAATLMGDTKGVLLVYYTDAANLNTDIDRFMDIVLSVHCD